MALIIIKPGDRELNTKHMKSLQEIRNLLKRVSIKIFDTEFTIRVEIDNKFDAGRIFIQALYSAGCNKTGRKQLWKGRKYYLSDHMTSDEVIKTCYAAFEAAVKHEIMESFKVDDIVLFNPHVSFEELLKISHLEVEREDIDPNKFIL